MKKKVLLSSICTIALCLCLIAGSTFALFTSQSDVNISVTAGDVDVVASIAIDKLESVKGDENGTITDENGATYSYEEVNPFTNGGTASVAEGLLTLDKVTPGDKVTFTVTGTNNSNVATVIRYIITCENGYTLMSGLVLHTPDGEFASVDTYTSAWDEVGVGSNFVKQFAIELPVDRGNMYEKQSTDIRILVEAVQGNAVVENKDTYTVEQIKQATAENVEAFIEDPTVPSVVITEDVIVTVDQPIANKVIDANGKDVQIIFTNTIENVTVTNIVETEGGNSINLEKATGELTVTKSSFISGAGNKNASIYTGSNLNADIAVEDSTFTMGSAKCYAIYGYVAGSVSFKNCQFTGFTSWAIQFNGQEVIDGDLTVIGCTFDVKAGIIKASPGVGGNFTFINNTVNCGGEGGDLNKVVVSTSKNTALQYAGSANVDNNTLNGDATWNPAVVDTAPDANN